MDWWPKILTGGPLDFMVLEFWRGGFLQFFEIKTDFIKRDEESFASRIKSNGSLIIITYFLV